MISSIEDFEEYISKEPDGVKYYCSICEKFRKRGRSDVKDHIESIHFPNSFSYQCQYCDHVVGTNKALTRHVQRLHKNV